MPPKYSRQREAIMNNLLSRYDHPTAEELYLDLKEELPNLSLGTLYRNLAMLSDNGTILKFHCGNADRFDGHNYQHYHLICDNCGRLYDLEHEPLTKLNETFAAEYGGEIRSHLLVFYGVCENCKSQQNNIK